MREFAEELRPKGGAGGRTLSLDASLERDLGLDSLGRAELLMRLEELFGLSLPDEVLANAETPRDLLKYLASAAPLQGGASSLEAIGIEAAGRGTAAPEQTRTLVEVLDWHVEQHPDRIHVAFEETEGSSTELSYAALQRRAHSVASGLQDLGLEHGETVGLMLPSGLDYFAAFFGIQVAGGIPVPLYPPVRRSQIEDHLKRQAGILRTAEVKFLIAFPEVRPLALLLRAQVPSLRKVVTVAELEIDQAALHQPPVDENAIAFLQFTSGSTGDPKGVILTHANLLANLRALGRAIDLGGDDRIVSWLPLYHDMGLIGAWMGSLYYAMPLALMSPLSFLARPSRWLWAIHRHRATGSAAPNFGYELCLKKIRDEEIEGLDLSSWRLALNGAESVSPETVRRFTERFRVYGFRPQALMPVYGLAECSLALAFPPADRGPLVDAVERDGFQRSRRARPASAGDPEAVHFVSCGLPLPGHEIRVVDPTGKELGEREEGGVLFRGPSATQGYYRRPEATRQLFHGDWVETGDLGYLAGGELFITGRVKDVLIRAGRNVYPHELEEAVGTLPGIRKGCVAVFASSDPSSGTEKMVVMAELRKGYDSEQGNLEREIESLAVDLTGTSADEVVLVPPHTVPKTSSGKIRRAASRELYESGRLGRHQVAVWWQMTRLIWTAAMAELARYRRTAGSYLYAGYFWTILGLAVIPIWLVMLLVPGLARRRRVARRIGRLLGRLTGTPLTVSGLEHLDVSKPSVLAVNHASYVDGFVLFALLPPNVSVVVKKELERHPIAGLALKRLGGLFVERFDPEEGIDDTRRATEAVRSGQTLVVFPEGTIRRAPGLLPFKMGTFVVAAEAGVPVVPMALRGTRSILRPDEWFPRRGAVTLTVCPPVEPEHEEWSAAVELRDAVRRQILAHCGEPDTLDQATH